jgi:spoIIIJ-associated protein
MSKQDVSAVVEQDSSPVVDSPAQGGVAVESALESPEVDTEAMEPVEVESLEADTAAGDSTDIARTATTGDDASARLPRKATKASALVREGEVAADFLEQLLDIADMDGDIDVDVDGDRAAVAIVDSEEGRVSRRLVGPDGKVLEALQELTRLAVQSATGERSRLMLDVAGHRAERRAALVTIARGVIATVKSTGEKQPMQPMTAFERKVVHDEVFASGLGSESEGAEPHRFVVILPA